MNGVDLHPEELLDRVRRGQATPSERERVHAHLQSCEACRFEHVLFAQSTRDAAPQPGDAARARNIEQAAVAALRARGLLTPIKGDTRPPASTESMHPRGVAALRAPRRTRRAGALLAAAVVSSLATAAAAAVLTQPAWLTRMIAPAPSAPPSPVRVHAARAHKQPAPVVAPVIVPPVAEPIAEPVPGLEAEPARVTAKGRAVARSAAEIFAAANAARREREAGSAARLYRELLRAHPRSAEASVAQVALGRLLLDRLGDARGALHEFDAYLADPQQRTLREDALIGRALALHRLGRARDEQAAWTALLAAFPASAYAEHAQARLLELR